jgi:NDP-sugar pyrophosphorylase family protein
MQCVILAGGLSTRLRPLTEKIPKSMIKIENKPFLEYQIELLKKNDIRDIILCVGYLANQIERYFRNGERFGVTLRYSYEKRQLLGTGGAIRNALKYLNNNFFILYGDSYLDIDYQGVYEYFNKISCLALLIVYNNENRWDKSNVFFSKNIVEEYDKENQTSEMKYIDYGLSILSKEIIKEIPEGIPYDLADLYKKLAKEKRLSGYEVFNRFYEIGSIRGIKEFKNFIKKRKIIG